ncbi:cytoplasmic protein [Mesobacillus boroniphilus]|uniref:Cytoplasmic protein n=1 Tax=Mesobacillus boroniphilus TaxID=308892 RepID=A0A944CP31_9BACI|nr:NIPSNAP family protein [Mesobacillus boroniphilus]MBS8266201.1 cytoplasmic protein [Mesobacillus boroniphilus]
MFYRRKFYIIKNDFVEPFNRLFTEINMPNQLKHGSRLIGRWMLPHNETTTEIFAIWEYDSYEDYVSIENHVRSDKEHLIRIQNWYEEHGGKEFVQKQYFVAAINEKLYSTIDTALKKS